MSGSNVLVIFGSTGDLTFQKLLPALSRLNQINPLLFEKILLIGRQVKTLDAYQAYGIDHGLDSAVLAALLPKLAYHYMQASNPDEYVSLAPLLNSYSGRFVYLATPPNMFHLVTEAFFRHGLIEKGNSNHRFAYEKPFGDNGSEATVLTHLLHEVLTEPQIYRVDHYLAKPFVQQLLKVRKQWDTVGFESFLHSNYLERIELIAYEKVGILSRGKFYDATGAIKDMIQSHLLETLALLTMELPDRLDNIDLIQENKVDFLTHLSPILSDIRLGQYQGYLQEPFVNPSSLTETYAYVSFQSQLPRWKSTIFTMATGKKLEEKKTQILLYFRDLGRMVIHLSPFVELVIDDKLLQAFPSPIANHLSLLQKHPFSKEEAYVNIFRDLMVGNQTLFPSAKEIDATWKIVDLIKQEARIPVSYHSLDDLQKEEA